MVWWAERLRITSDGKIGIGTDSPDSDAYIHIVGTDNGKIILEDNDNNGANSEKIILEFKVVTI